MKIENKAWWVELVWIISLLLLTLLVDFLIFGRSSVLQDTIGLQVHDTYYVIGGLVWTTILFLLIATGVYVFKEARRAYHRTLPNLILLALAAAMLFVVFKWHYIFTRIEGWTVYPPLSSLSGSELREIALSASDESGNFVFVFVELLLVTGLLLLGFRTKQIGDTQGG